MIIGEYSVGKTTLMHQFCNQSIPPPNNPLWVDFMNRTVVLNDSLIKIMVFDTAKQERFNSGITKSYYRIVSGIILAYDITNRVSFNRVGFWYNNCKNSFPARHSFVLVGLKSELSDEREVKKEEGESLAQEYGIPFFEASSIQNKKVEDIFLSLASIMMQNLPSDPQSPQINSHKACC